MTREEHDLDMNFDFATGRPKKNVATTKLTDKDIGDALTGMIQRFDDELYALTDEELRERWYFKFEPERSLERNIYNFHGTLTIYGRSCRRWEEKHNGSCCVVERVRDKYLMPKIREFAALVRNL